MKQIIKPYLAHILCIVFAALHIGCTEEILPTDTDAMNGNHPGVHLTLLPPTITLDAATATTRTGGETAAAIQEGSQFVIQLVDANGKVLKQKNGRLQQSWFTYSGGIWTLQDSHPSTPNGYFSQAITVTGGAGNYRMRVLGKIMLADEEYSSPITYFGSVSVTDNGDETGTFALNLKHNLTAALQVKLVGDNGAELPDNGNVYKLVYHPENLPAIQTMFGDFSLMTFTDKTVNKLDTLKDAGQIAPIDRVLDNEVSFSDAFLTKRMPCFEPITSASAGKEIITIKEIANDAVTVVKTYTVTAPAAGITLAAGSSYLLTVSLNGRDATIESFTIADMEDGGTIEVEQNKHIEKIGDTYQIKTAQGLKVFADIVNGGKPSANGKLMHNIDLSTICSSELGDWTPIGKDWDTKFDGIFDGNNKTISNLYIGASTSQLAGLFGAAEGTLQNITLTDPSVKSTHADGYVGGVVGLMSDGTISNCHIVGGMISGGGGANAEVGGIVGGTDRARIIACTTTGSAVTDGANVGGIVGDYVYVNLDACLATTTTISSSNTDAQLGGIVGHNNLSTEVANYFTPSVVGADGKPLAGATDNINTLAIVGSHTAAVSTASPAENLNFAIAIANSREDIPYHYEVNPAADADANTLPLIVAGAPVKKAAAPINNK